MSANFTKLKPIVCLALSSFLLTGLLGCGGGGPTEKVDEKQALIDSFTTGAPDPTKTFPEAEFAKAKELKKEHKLDSAEKLLLSKLEDAKVAARNTTQLGQYLVRLNNILYDEGKDADALQYGEIAVTIFNNQPMEKRPVAPWYVNIYSYLGMSYARQHKYDKAEQNLLKAISIASGAPKAEVAPAWIKLIYEQLISCYEAEKKKDQAAKVKEQLAKLHL